ncbi:MAG TPA: outer membrane beta-barrel protein [Verrucomicrobiae bacterium]|jgi:hypothetical protein
MAAQQHATASRSVLGSSTICLLAFLLLLSSHPLSAQKVDPDTVTLPSTQTNAVSTNQAPIFSDFDSTNLPSLSTNVFQSTVLPVPRPYAESPAATIGTGRLASPLYGTSALTGPSANVPIPASLPGLWQAGDVSLRAILSETMIYGNGLEYAPGNQTSTFVSEFTPAVVFNAGRNWVLNYAPTFYDYASSKFHDDVAQSESIVGSAAYQDWRFGMAQSYADSSQPLVETGEQTSSQVTTAMVTAARQMGDQLSFDVGLNWTHRVTPGFDNIDTWSGGPALFYSPIQQVSFNLNFNGGYDLISVGSDIVYESLEAGITFRPREKLTLSLSGGAQDMQFVNPSAPALLSPIFNASLQYKATATTLIGVTASETVTPSFFANQIITSKSVAASIQQQLSPKFSLSLAGSYSSEPYTSIEVAPLPQFYLGIPPVSVLETVRSDTFETLNVRLTYLFSSRITASIFYTLSENASGQGNFKYTSLQEGLSLSYVF